MYYDIGEYRRCQSQLSLFQTAAEGNIELGRIRKIVVSQIGVACFGRQRRPKHVLNALIMVMQNRNH
jgi:hypothetical protein